MNKRIFGGVALAGMLLAQLIAAGPSSAAPQTITKSRTTGEAVVAAFDSTDVSGCIRTQLSVLAINETGDNPGNLATVVIFQGNTCLNQTLINGFGTTTDFDMAVAESLSNGSLKMNLTFANTVNNTLVPMTFEGSWSAVAKNNTSVIHDKFTAGGVTFFSTSQSKERSARAMATATFGEETLFDSHASFDGTIASGFTKAMTHGEDTALA